MDAGAEVVGHRAAERALEVHRRERRDPDVVDVGAREDRDRDVGHGVVARADAEVHVAREGRAVEHGLEAGHVALRRVEPEVPDDRELLGVRSARAERHRAAGQAVDHVAADGAEVARALHDEELVHVVGRVEVGPQTEAGEPGAGRLGGDLVEVAVVEVEERGREGDGLEALVGQELDVDRIGEVEPRRQEVDGVVLAHGKHRGLARDRPDRAIGVIGEVVEGRRERVGRRARRARRQALAGHVDQGGDALLRARAGSAGASARAAVDSRNERRRIGIRPRDNG